jgi:hypothetical protein
LGLILGLQEVEEDVLQPRVASGSRPGRRGNIERDRLQMHAWMMKDYFCDNLIYGPTLFRRRFRMRRSLFETILERVCRHDRYFVQKLDACGLLGLSAHQKITSALRMLCYGLCGDATNEYCRTYESTAMECLRRFCLAIKALFEDYYMHQPTQADFDKQLAVNEACGFPGMFTSMDCMHWEWKNCPVAWQGDFGDRNGRKSIILEAIASEDLHIWHAFFGLLGSNNDLNVLDCSPLVESLLTSIARDRHFSINGCDYDRYYLLTDGIFPKWSIFVQSIHLAPDEKRAYFSERQEAVRKDIERCFGMLQSRFAIVRNPSRHWTMEVINDIMHTCCILHNMIVEDEQNVEGLEDIIAELQGNEGIHVQRGLSFDELLTGTIDIHNVDKHYSLRWDLIEHLWSLKGIRNHA